MFTYICIVIAALLALNTSNSNRIIACIVLAEFVAHKIIYIVGIQLTDLLNYHWIYLAYACVETLAIVAILQFQPRLAIMTLIFLNLTYNMLTISQYAMSTYDFYSSYKAFIQPIMVLELIYLVWITDYVANYRRKYKHNGVDISGRSFFVYRRRDNRRIL